MLSRRERLLAETTAIRAVLRNGDIGRLELGWLAANAGAYGFLVVTLVAAYNSGGAFAADLMTVVRYVPPTVLASLAGFPTARWRADRVLLAVNLIRAVSMALTLAMLAASAPIAILFVLVAVEAGFGGLTRPLHISVLPWLARTLVDSIAAAAAAVGGLVAAPLLAGLGIRGALVVTGAILPVAAAIMLPGLRRAEAATVGNETSARLLRADPLLQLLSLSVIEDLAAVARRVDYEDGTELIREGEPGNEYLIIAAGEVDVSRCFRRVFRRLGPGHGVGEIALLRKVPRTATVRAVGPVQACALHGDAFLSAITGHLGARQGADRIVDAHLTRSSTPPPL